MKKVIPLVMVAGAFGLLVYAFLRSTPSQEVGETPRGLDTEFRGVETVAKEALLGTLPVDPGSFSVELVGKPVCGAADGDIIAIDRKAGAAADRYLATIEPLGSFGQRRSPVVAAFPDVPKGSRVNVSLPLSLGGEARQFGFFLCYDKDGTKRCGDKKIAAPNEVFAASMMKGKSYVPDARVYVFAYLFFDGRRLRAFTDIVPDEYAYRRLREFVAFFEPMSRNPDAATTEMGLAKNADQVLAPHPFVVENGRVTMPLGYFDESACPKEPKAGATAPSQAAPIKDAPVAPK